MLVSLVSSHLSLCFHVVTFCKPLVVEYEIAEMMAGNETAEFIVVGAPLLASTPASITIYT